MKLVKMYRKYFRKNEKGFSLVELMVVVAIIGILATLSVGSIQKQVAKSRQSEAKTALSSLWSAESAFHSEFGTYYSNMQSIKFSVEGNARYSTGMAVTAAFNASAYGYAGAGSTAPGSWMQTCGATVADGTCANGLCTCLASAQINVTAGTAGVNTFTARSINNDLLNGNNDEWQIDDVKVLTNPTDGVN